MRIRILSLALLAIALPLSSCSDKGILAPIAVPPSVLANHMEAAPPEVRFSEIHYDNGGTDSGEAIEISGPAGTDVTGWKIYLYNGSTGLTYEPTRTLAGTIPASCEGRGVLFETYPVNGIQNGDPDGIALVNAAGHVIEFLSYEGTFAALNGPAIGMTATQIPRSEEHTSELQSPCNLVCRLLLEKIKIPRQCAPVMATSIDGPQQPARSEYIARMHRTAMDAIRRGTHTGRLRSQVTGRQSRTPDL